MAFVLRVKGDDGEESRFEFDGVEARLGRTADNDIVVKDTQASRNHARVYERNGSCFLEDLQSANGTRHNGVALTGPMPLKSGDELSIGVVTFVFEQKVEPAPQREAVPEGHTSTEVPPQGVDVSAVQHTHLTGPPEPSVMVAPEMKVGEPFATKAERASKDNFVPSQSAETPRRPLPMKQLPDGTAAAPQPVSGVSVPSAGALTRFERLSPKVRFAFGSLLTLLVIAVIVAGALFATRGEGPKPKNEEPSTLEPMGKALSQSFGWGPNVRWPRVDSKLFRFTLNNAGPMVAVLHLQARDLASDEVSVSLNGAAQGWLPPDTADVATREIEMVLSAREMKAREPNQLIFDNVKNPPGTDTWRIWNVWLEVIDIPKLSAEQLTEEAEADMRRGADAYELKDVAVGNLFKAWVNYRHAWLKLESLEPRPADPYEAARARLNELRPLLDGACNALVSKVQSQLASTDPQSARATVEEMALRFPAREHRCYDIALQYQQDLNGL
ncbi:MAG: FHA domain-containing protein [Myxococcaceae bacterium]|nr:FHA domain-containing protein [Myxococcaceae bacterium]